MRRRLMLSLAIALALLSSLWILNTLAIFAMLVAPQQTLPFYRAISTLWSPFTSFAAQPRTPATGPFPGRADDLDSSLGSFKIFVNPAFQSLVTGNPYYDSATGRLSSPTLFDLATQIGRSDVITKGTAAYAGGVPVGTAGTLISTSHFVLTPTNFGGPAGTRAVRTVIKNFDLSLPGGPRVRAGAAAPNRPFSPGEVESQSGASNDANLDFPANSFFDVFVEVDLPSFGSVPSMTLYNPYPLLVTNYTVTHFPPKVVYIHGNSNAVPILFRDNGPSWQAGQLFGWLVLAGHGMSYRYEVGDIGEFNSYMQTLREMPLPCSAFDFNPDLRLDSQDLNLMLPRWHAPSQYDARYDVGLTGPDNGIFVDDLQRVSGCQGKTPAGRFDPLTVRAGDDLLHSPPNQSALNINYFFPPGFFGTKNGIPSDPFPIIGTMQLQAVPITTTTPSGSQEFQPRGSVAMQGSTSQRIVVDVRESGTLPDTIVRRLNDATFGEITGTLPNTAAIPIEIVALSLVSVNPINVTYGFTGNPPSVFDVKVDLQPGTQPSGMMTITRTGAFSGTFSSVLPVNSRLTFINRDSFSGPDQPQDVLTHTDQLSTLAAVPWILTPTLPPPSPQRVSDGALRTAATAVTPTLSAQPLSQTVDISQTFTVSVVVGSATNLGAFEFTMSYSPTLVEVLTVTQPVSNFLGSTGRTVTVPPAAPIISATAGTVSYAAFTTGSQSGVNGSGTLAIVTMRSKAAGTSPLTFMDTINNPLILADPTGNALGASPTNAQVTIQFPYSVFLPLVIR
jgi:hypothetical protein